MAQQPALPKIGVGFIPVIPRPGILPMRVVPRLVPRFFQAASRVRVHVHAVTLPSGRTVPEADLTPKLISNSFDDGGNFHEYYMLMRGGDPEGVMDLWTGPDAEEGTITCEISRLAAAAMDIYLDETLMFSLPEITPDMAPPFVGQVGFGIPIQGAKTE